jgi:hypothetical protein
MPACAVAYALTRTDAYAPAHEHFEHLIAQLHSPEAHQMTHSELEALLEVEGRELLRRLFQAHVDERSPGIAAEPVLDAEGHPCLPQRCHTRHLMTLFGEVAIVRMGAQCPKPASPGCDVELAAGALLAQCPAACGGGSRQECV